MNKVEAELKSGKKLVGKGKDCLESYVVKIDLEKLSNLLEKEGSMDEDLGEVVIRLEGYPSLKIFPIAGSYYPDVRRIDIYLFKDRGWYRIYQFFGFTVKLSKEKIVSTLAHEIDHAIRYLKIERKFGIVILALIGVFSDLVYPISPFEILARRFARAKMIESEWLECVQIKNKTKN